MAAKRTGAGAARTASGTSSRRRRPPVLLGAIDIGSTAMRMNIAEYAPDRPMRIIEELTHPISTGADSFRSHNILPETLFSIRNTLNNFLRLLNDYDVRHRRAVASSAVREASNRELLVDRIRHESGLELEILDAVEESRLAYRALLPWLRQHPNSYSMTLNLGGGSTETMILRGDDLQVGGSKRLGTARLFHAVSQGGGNQSRAELARLMAANMVNSTREFYQDYNISQFFLINRILYRAFRKDPAARAGDHDFVMPADTLHERIQRASGLNSLELGRLYNIGLAETELLIPAMMILDNFVAASEVEEVTFTDTDVLSGLLIEMGMVVQGENPLMAFRQQMVRSARAIGEQYFYDRTHARAVTDFSLIIFDTLRDTLDLRDKDRLLLELAAVLHDIGGYVSEHHHHRHSAYLIKWSDIVGLNENDRVLTSQIAFFHRKEMPSADHPEFMALSREDRVRVSKLAGILRVADVLDRGHGQGVRDLRAEIVDDKLLLYLEITGDLGIILDHLPKKADLLEQVTGLQVVLRREMPRV